MSFVYEGPDWHMLVRNARTGRLGSCYTPTEDLSTACRAVWDARPRRTLRWDLVTCAVCLATRLHQGAGP